MERWIINMKLWYTVAYDVSSDKARRKIGKICSTYMQRVQYSVFEAYLSEANFKNFYQKIKMECSGEKWNSQTDSVLIYKHCASCYAERICIGKKNAFSKNYFIL